MTPTRRVALRLTAVLAALVALGVVLQIYFIASYIFGAGTDALDLHRDTGGWVHLLEILAFIAGAVAWWKRWPLVGLAFALPVIGTIQIAFSEGDEWVGGLHGLLALAVGAVAGRLIGQASRELKGDAPVAGARPAGGGAAP